MSLIFVFGSNLKGIHGIGAALTAKMTYGAQQGVGRGPTGRAYAIPTKENPHKILSLDRIQREVAEFIEYAKNHPDQMFKVTRIGCGYAGYADTQISPMFLSSPENCVFDIVWHSMLGLYTFDKKPRTFFNLEGFLRTIEL